MSNLAGIRALARSFGNTAKRLACSRRGVAAIEFAFVVPVLLILYFVTIEISHAIETNKKVGRAASMIADLITQQQQITPTELDAIFQIGESTLQPYNRSQPSFYVTGIAISDDEAAPKSTVEWSREMTNGESEGRSFLIEDAPVTVPPELLIPGTFLVRVQTTLDYRPIIAWTADQKQKLGLLAAFDNIDMSEEYYLRPRMSNDIPCGDC